MSRSTERGRRWGLALLVLLSAPAALAEPSAADRDQALTLLKDGLARGEAGDLRGATERLEQAYALVSSPVIGLELARSLRRERRLVEALDAARRAASVAYPDTARTTSARADATRLADELEPHIPSVRLSFEGVPAGVTPAVSLDATVIPPAALALPRKVNPGSHIVVATLPDGREARTRLEATEDETAELTLRFPPVDLTRPVASASALPPVASLSAPPPWAPPPLPPTTGPGPLRTVGYALGAGGLVGLGLGTFFGLRARSLHDDALGHCPGDVCTDQARSLQSDARSAATASTISFIAGGTLLAGGLALVLLAPSSTSSTSAALAPTLAPGLVGARWSGSW